jgi:hypothetical protein
MFKKFMGKLNKNQILIGVAVLAIIVTAVLVSSKSNSNSILSFLKLNTGMSVDEISKKSIDYLNKAFYSKDKQPNW